MPIVSEQEFLQKIGFKIKTIRNEKGFSLNELATNHGFEKASLSRLEAGKANITLKTLFKLSIALGVEARDFFEV